MSPRPVVSVSIDAAVEDAHALAQKEGVHHLLVLRDGEIVGLLCLCDLREAPLGTHVAACMSRPVVSVDAESALEVAALCMRSQDVGCLPVVDANRVLGVITRGDLRRMGVPPEIIGLRECASCGGTHHVRSFSNLEDVAFCVECLERGPECDLGEVD